MGTLIKAQRAAREAERKRDEERKRRDQVRKRKEEAEIQREMELMRKELERQRAQMDKAKVLTRKDVIKQVHKEQGSEKNESYYMSHFIIGHTILHIL